MTGSQGVDKVEKVLFSWSGGKDSAMALYEILAGGQYQVAALLTTVTKDYDRISMHGVRRVLLEGQAESLGLHLEEIWISRQSSNDEYESKMAEVLKRYKEAGVTSVVFGDIFLEDLKEYREKNLAGLGMKGIFPLWKRDSAELIRSFIARGFKAVTVCVDTQALDRRFVGRTIDEQFVADLPQAVDVCGENGEFHSFVYDGPIFKNSIPHKVGEIVLRDERFYYCDLIPV
jgi:uncharacterized protein (TIGR00290 family)